jgi:hypothetical protein
MAPIERREIGVEFGARRAVLLEQEGASVLKLMGI